MSGAYTINSALPTAGTNYATFTAAVTALTAGGVSGPVTFTVSGGPYTEQISIGQFTGASAANRVTFEGGGRTIQFGSNTSAQRGVITLNGADYLTLNNLVVDVLQGGTVNSTYGWGVHVLNSSNNDVISNCTIISNGVSSSANFAGIVSSTSTTSATATGTTASQNLTISGNNISGGYYGISVVGSGSATAPTPGLIIRDNIVRDSYLYGIYTTYQGGAQIIGNDVARPIRGVVNSFFGIYLGAGTSSAAVEKNRIHQAFGGVVTSPNSAYGIYLTTSTAATATTSNNVVNNLVYDFEGAGAVYGLYNGTSRYARYYNNTVNLDFQGNTGSGDAFGFYQSTGLGVEFRNNVVNVTRSGTGVNYALYLESATGTITSNNNDLTGSRSFVTGFYNTTPYATLASWRTANGGIYDQGSTNVSPQFVSPATGSFQPTASPLNGTAAALARVTEDITGATRSTTPDMGAYEFAPQTNDVALVSIDAPVGPANPGAGPVTVTVRNNGTAVLATVRLEYVLNSGTAVGQTFTLAGSGLAPNATQALSFTVLATLVAGGNTLTVTGSLPNGQPDGLAANNTLSLSLFTAMTGAYTINSAQPTGGTNFVSFTAAVAQLMSGGVSGPVTFTVSGGPYTEQITLGDFIGASAANRVTFDGGGRTIQFGSADANLRSVITLNGADYVTFNNLAVDATVGGTSTAAFGWGIHLLNNSDNCVINNCTVTTNIQQSPNYFAGIVSSAEVGSLNAYGPRAPTQLTLTNNTVIGGYYGISVFGSDATGLPTTGVIIRNNNVRDVYNYGIYTGYLSGAQIVGNDISRPSRSVVSYFHGIHLDAGMRGTAVEKNRIHQPLGGSTASQDSYGIYVNTGADAPATAPNDFVNNVVYDFIGNSSAFGIYNDASDNARYYHNTINLNSQTTTNNSSAYGFYQTTGQGVEFRNNIVNVTRSGTGANYAMYLESATGTTISNNNNLTGSGTTFQTGYYDSTPYATLANWQTANSNAFDQNSTAIAPLFVSASTLQPTVSTLNNTGAPLPRVTDDILGATRSTTTPDMGAYEFTPPADDVALVRIDSPAAPVAAGVQPIAVNVRNNGATVLTSVRLEYVLNGGAPVGETFTLPGGLASGASRTLLFTTSATIVAGANTLTVTGSLPNGNPDTDPSNNVLTTTVFPALSGIYTINQTLPTAGTNFASFTAAGTALNLAGIIGAVRFNVLNGPYVEQFAPGIIPGASATDTVVVDGGTSKQTLRHAGTAAAPAVVLLNGTDYVTLQNLTIDATPGTTYGVGVHLVAQANNIRVANCVITSPTANGNTFVNAGIATSGAVTQSTTAGSANNLRVENNVISDGHYGIILSGLAATSPSTGARITGNEIRDFIGTGISVENTSGTRVLNNNIHRLNRTVVSSFTGILLVGNVGAAVESNRIHDDFTANQSSTAGTFGIYARDNIGTVGNENDVVNNLIYNFTGAGQQYGIFNANSDYIRFYHNTISLDYPLFTGSEQCYGFAQTTTGTGIEFRNNIVSVTRPGGGERYALDLQTTATGIVSNNNDLFVGTAIPGSANYNIGRYGTTLYPTLASWRTANGGAFDQNSLQVNPLYAAPTTGNFLPTETLLNGAGTVATLARVPRDITNALRTSPPDPGAYELVLVANDVVLVSIDSPNTPAVPGTNAVLVTIRNGGSTMLNTVQLSHALAGGATINQAFTGLNLAAGASRQLTFTQGVVLPSSGTFTLTVTASLPNGQPDGNPANNVLTITFDQPTVVNDEPCGAIGLGAGTTTGSNSGATTTVQPTIITPACSPASLPKDVWFTFAPSGTSTTLTLTGAPAGMVRIFTTPNCASGPFTQVFCQGSGTANTAVGAVTVPGLTPGQRYYVAVSGYAGNDTGGQFTISATSLLATKVQTNSTALTVFPNPSSTGQFTLQVSRSLGTGTVELLNALGQVVQRQPLAATSEQTVRTTGLAAGLYTLRVQAGSAVLTRKVVLQ